MVTACTGHMQTSPPEFPVTQPVCIHTRVLNAACTEPGSRSVHVSTNEFNGGGSLGNHWDNHLHAERASSEHPRQGASRLM